MTKLTILFDADDVAENLLTCWLNALNIKYGTSCTEEDVTDWNVSLSFPSLTRDQVYAVLQDDQLWKSLAPVPGAEQCLKQLHDEGHELYMVTATDYRTCKEKVSRILELFPWLDQEHIIVAHKKQMVCGDVLIDDNPQNLIGGPYFRVLFDKPHNRNFEERKHGIYRANDWDQVYRLIHDNLVTKGGDEF